MIKAAELSEFVDTYCSTVYNACRRNTPNVDTAWEAYQETFLVLVRRQDSLDMSEDWSPWLRETARRCSLAVLRKQRTGENAPIVNDQGQELFSINSEVADSAELTEMKDILQQELAGLCEADRSLLHMVYVDDKTHREVAEAIDCPAGSVHARVSTAKDRLRARLKRRGVELGAALLMFLFCDFADGADSFSGENNENSGTSDGVSPPMAAASTTSAWIGLIAASVVAVVSYTLYQPSGEPTIHVDPIVDSAQVGSTGSADSGELPKQSLEFGSAVQELPNAMPF